VRLMMTKKPAILFIAITPHEYTPANVDLYGAERTFQLIPHKHSVLSLVAWLRENGCDGYYSWINRTDGENLAKLENFIRVKKPDAIGFSLVTEEIVDHYTIIKYLKDKFPELAVIAGGPHVTAMPVHTLQNFPLIDFVCIGEGEVTLTEWLKAVAGKKGPNEMRSINGLAFRDNSYGVVTTQPREKFTDINIIPDPAFDLIADADCIDNKSMAFPVVASYGCRYSCTFCQAANSSYRYITPRRFVDQIQRAQEKFGVDYFAIRDSFWPPTSEWLNEFCDLVENRELNIQFHFETRAGALNLGQLARLKLIGVQAIAVGVESGDPEILKSIRKGITPALARKTFDNLHKSGIPSVAFFMFGNQGETLESIRKSVDLAHELNSTLLSLSTFRPFPGTEAYNFVRDEERDWWMHGDVPTICELSNEDLDHIHEEVHIWYPMRVAYLVQNVFVSRLPGSFRKLAWQAFKVHLRKCILGVSEQSAFMRFLIHSVKRLVRRYAQLNAEKSPENGS
jgi:radical SAM superfamily enzyme YgiQ (UPF0313 family)